MIEWIETERGIGIALAILNEVEVRIPVALWLSGFVGALAVLVEWVEQLHTCPVAVGLPMLV